MQDSQLIKIINRLAAMIEDQTNSVQERRFNVDGVERAKVIYDQDKKMFTIIDRLTDEALEFDQIDFAAIEIFELIQSTI